MTYSHHALLAAVPEPQDYVLELSDSNPYLIDRWYEKFGINEVREVVGQANLKPAQSDKLLIVIRLQSITVEAQNALLKILEEPPISTNFLFVVPEDIALLSTLESRFQRLQITSDSEPANSEFSEFTKSTLKDQLTLIEKETKNKNTAWMQAIKSGLVQYLQSTPADLPGYRELETVSRLLLTRGASNKMLLEHCALLMSAREK
jgi:DNA polymerase III delta prime subunit